MPRLASSLATRTWPRAGLSTASSTIDFSMMIFDPCSQTFSFRAIRRQFNGKCQIKSELGHGTSSVPHRHVNPTG